MVNYEITLDWMMSRGISMLSAKIGEQRKHVKTLIWNALGKQFNSFKTDNQDRITYSKINNVTSEL